MRAVAVNFETRRLEVLSVPEPREPSATGVLFRVDQVGVCGTDREIVSGRLVLPPPGEDRLIIGHEALGQVLAVGRGVTNLKPGDWVAPMVRRSCSTCEPCARGRADLCSTGDYVERGIVRLDGYFTDLAVDHSDYLPRVPAELTDCAVLIEPLSVVEKAIEVARRAHNEYYSFHPQRVLVIGAGAVGILSALAMQAREFEVAVSSLEDIGHPRARMLEAAGIRYLPSPANWPCDFVIEAAGSAKALAAALESLEWNGVMVTLGAPNARVEFPFRQMIVKNQTLAGSVNASRQSFEAAIADLARFDRKVLNTMIHRVRFDDFGSTLAGPPSEHVKPVHMMC